jgi:hypothetical protein
MSERLQLKGMLHDLKLKKMRIVTAADANIKAVRNLLATASITPLEEIDLRSALIHLQEAVDQQKQYLETCNDIVKIEKELE